MGDVRSARVQKGAEMNQNVRCGGGFLTLLTHES